MSVAVTVSVQLRNCAFDAVKRSDCEVHTRGTTMKRASDLSSSVSAFIYHKGHFRGCNRRLRCVRNIYIVGDDIYLSLLSCEGKG